CIGCGACMKACPVNAISGIKRNPHLIDQDVCIKCGECMKACKFKAIERAGSVASPATGKTCATVKSSPAEMIQG
ncbi:MAG: 4Fe-4S dicluster domain-containing protein, partial [Spirochaetaceae bacterium]